MINHLIWINIGVGEYNISIDLPVRLNKGDTLDVNILLDYSDDYLNSHSKISEDILRKLTFIVDDVGIGLPERGVDDQELMIVVTGRTIHDDDSRVIGNTGSVSTVIKE